MTGVADWFKIGADATSAYSGYKNSQTLSGISKDMQGYSAGLNNEQQYYRDQLKSLVSDPSSFLDNPLYKAAFSQGEEAVNRSAAAKGFSGSGNQAAALQQYGQSMAFSALTDQEKILGQFAGLSGNPSEGLGTAANIQEKAGGYAGDLIKDIGQYYGEDIVSGAKKLFGISDAANPTAASMASDAGTAMSQTPQIADLAGLGDTAPSLEGFMSGAGGAASLGTDAAGIAGIGSGVDLLGGGAATAGLDTLASTVPSLSVAGETAGATAGGGGLAGFGAIAAPAASLAALAYGAYKIIDADTQGHNATALPLGEDQSYYKLPNGNDGIRQGNVVYGTGTDSSKGASNYFMINDKTGQSAWLGVENRGTLDNFVSSVQKYGSVDAPVVQVSPNNGMSGGPHSGPVEGAIGKDPTTGDYFKYVRSNPGSRTDTSLKKVAYTPPTVKDTYGARLQGIYDQYGGQDAWGTDFNGWLNDLVGARSHVTGRAYG